MFAWISFPQAINNEIQQYVTTKQPVIVRVLYRKNYEQIFVESFNNRPLPSCHLPLFQNESMCETSHMKMCSNFTSIFMQIIFIWMAGFARRLVLELRQKATRKYQWPIWWLEQKPLFRSVGHRNFTPRFHIIAISINVVGLKLQAYMSTITS